MRILSGLVFLGIAMALVACNKEEPDDTTNLPEGATPYTEADIQFVPYQSGNRVFKKLPLLDSTLELQFVERSRTEEYFAWDQTFFKFSNDTELEAEFRLRYLQSDNSQKTLAIYMPYRDLNNISRTNLFELPISHVGIETGLFQNLIDFHDTLVLNSIMWYDVYEVKPLLTTDSIKDGLQNYNRIYYNSVYGLIKMNQKNGTEWMLQQ
ncbi:MAG: hypothetical protein IPO32_07165 [Crocinitomicaceae bacterium]|jgi:hypothetical protein|nr:hypothetical protein [Crocinitomicaceae bacterium]MBK6952110.1 hypothetical protein [Crocinitomicaceae bacterium]MBK9591276.1 hypothetical protein [Crocinitomicaceae bacterium]